jgi:hypothetical protein
MLDLAEDAGNNEKVLGIEEELGTPIHESKNKWKTMEDHIILKNSVLEHDGISFKDLRFSRPLVIRAGNLVAYTIEGNRQFGFASPTNDWLSENNFTPHLSQEN